MMRAWPRLPRRRKMVSFFAASQPITGQARTSALDTKAAGASALMTKMSTQEMWLATSMQPGSTGSPRARARMPSTRSSPCDQRRRRVRCVIGG
jgi:hypothetical protein